MNETSQFIGNKFEGAKNEIFNTVLQFYQRRRLGDRIKINNMVLELFLMHPETKEYKDVEEIQQVVTVINEQLEFIATLQDKIEPYKHL